MISKKRMRRWAVGVLIAWFNGLNAKGSDTEGEPVLVKVVDANSNSFVVEMKRGYASSDHTELFQVTVKVEKLGKK